MAEPPALHPEGAAPGGVTILRPVSSAQPMTKVYRIASNGVVTKAAVPNVSLFRVEMRQLEGIGQLHSLVQELDGDPDAVVIRGAPLVDVNLQNTLRRSKAKKEKGRDGVAKVTPATFGETPRAWFMLDLDGVTLPPGTSVLTDPHDTARFLLDMIAAHAPELEGITAVVQFSSSAGISEMAEAEAAAGMPARWGGVAKPGNRIGAHIWYWLERPQDSEALKRWAEKINAEADAKVIDTTLMQSIQLHFTAAPIFGQGLRDPLQGRRVVLVKGAADAVALTIPEKPQRGPYVPGQSSLAGVGYTARLDRIGKPGFKHEITAAISSYVWANWPNPDQETLIKDLQQRIEAADPGGRSTSEIERYASEDWLKPLVAWVMDQEQSKQDEKAAEAARAEAVDPTFPDKTVTLEAGQRLASAAVARFTEAMRRGERLDMLLQITVGGGKSEAAVRGAADLLDAAREGGREGALFYLVPRHDLGSEIAARIQAAHPGKAVAIWRGMDAADPAQPGKQMCHDPELPQAARAAGLDSAAVCSVCPLREECGYRRQRQQHAEVWIAAHNLAFQGLPSPLPPPAAIVIDEAFWQAALVGTDGPPLQIALSSLRDDRTGLISGLGARRLRFLRTLVADVLEKHEAGGLMREAFERAGLTAASAAEWYQMEWSTKIKLTFNESDRAGLLEQINAVQDQSGFLARRATLAGFVRALLESPDARSINATFEPHADLGCGQGSGPAVRMAWRDDFAKWTAEAPKLFLDATTAPEVLKVWVPALEVETIEIEAPGQIVIQAADREYGRATFTQNTNNIGRLGNLVAMELAKASGGEVLVIVQKAVEDSLKADLMRRFGGELPPGLHLAHHGAITGMDGWRNVARVLVVGRPAMNRTNGERLGEIVRGAAVEIVANGDQNFWPTVPAGIRMVDGTGRAVEQPRHPDPLVEALRWSITEGAVLQAIGRARGVQRPGGVHVTLLASLALPLTVHELMTWGDLLPSRLDTAIAEAAITGRALPLAPADLATARPDLWATVKAAQHEVERWAGGNTPQVLIRGSYKELGGITPARYRKQGSTRWNVAAVPTQDGRAALEAVLGPLADYEAVMPQAAPQRPAQAPKPRPAPAMSPQPAAPPPDALEAVLVVMGEAPPFDVTPNPRPTIHAAPQIVPSPPPPRATLAALGARLDRVKPPRMLADGFDDLRVMAWRDRCAQALAAYAVPMLVDYGTAKAASA